MKRVVSLASSCVVVSILSCVAIRAQEPTLRLRLGGATERDVMLFPARDVLDAIVAQQGEPPADAAPRDAAAVTLRGAILDAVTSFVVPPFADGEEAKWLGHEHLAVIGRPAQHEWVAAFLARAQAAAGSLVFLEIEILRCGAPLAQGLAIGDQPAVLLAKELAALRDRFGKAGVDQLIAPRVLVYPLQHLSLSVGDQVAYVKDVEVVKLDGGKTIADPVIDVLQTGFSFDGSVAIVDQDKFVLSCAMRFAELERPIAERRVELVPGAGEPVTIQLPKLEEIRCDAKILLGEGQTALLPCPEFRGQRRFLLVTARRQAAGSGGEEKR